MKKLFVLLACCTLLCSCHDAAPAPDGTETTGASTTTVPGETETTGASTTTVPGETVTTGATATTETEPTEFTDTAQQTFLERSITLPADFSGVEPGEATTLKDTDLIAGDVHGYAAPIA